MSETTNLPAAFLTRMEKLLGAEYEEFIKSYEQERYYGLRYNPLKATDAEFERRMPFTLEPVTWAREGYYYRVDEQPGRHILHEAGAYYIQEPSAMAVVEILDPQPGSTSWTCVQLRAVKARRLQDEWQGMGFSYPTRSSRGGRRSCLRILSAWESETVWYVMRRRSVWRLFFRISLTGS